jgi:hypothetical protein
MSLDTENLPLYGICEWENFYRCADIRDSDRDPVEETVFLHKKMGFKTMVWALGRDRLDYHSELPGVTPVTYDHSLHTRIIKSYCPLRKAIKLCAESGMDLWGRLCMNRHYPPGSKFAQEHADLYQVNFDGSKDFQRMTYASETVRRERREILLEAQRIGVGALLLDFCRQQPHAAYHPLETEPFVRESGSDPRNIKSTDPDDFMPWFRHRAAHVTMFMRELRAAVRKQERGLGRSCPVVPRVPDAPFWLLVAGGMDLETWYREDLIDGHMLSPFPWCVNDISRYPEAHTGLARRHGKPCIGGIGALNLITQKIPVPHVMHESFDAHPLWLLAERQINAGAAGLSVYQSESVCRMPWLEDIIPNLGRPEMVGLGLQKTGSRYGVFFTGLDWHARMEYGLNGTFAYKTL